MAQSPWGMLSPPTSTRAQFALFFFFFGDMMFRGVSSRDLSNWVLSEIILEEMKSVLHRGNGRLRPAQVSGSQNSVSSSPPP